MVPAFLIQIHHYSWTNPKNIVESKVHIVLKIFQNILIQVLQLKKRWKYKRMLQRDINFSTWNRGVLNDFKIFIQKWLLSRLFLNCEIFSKELDHQNQFIDLYIFQMLLFKLDLGGWTYWTGYWTGWYWYWGYDGMTLDDTIGAGA